MTPDQLKKEYPLTDKVIHTVMTARTVKNILAKRITGFLSLWGHVQFMTLRRPENMRAN